MHHVYVSIRKQNSYSIHLGQYRVTLLVFSGRPDPVYCVSPQDTRFNDIKTQLEEAKQRLDLTPDIPSILGYKGFLVEDNQQRYLIRHQETVPLQRLLLEIFVQSNEITPQLRDMILQGMDAG